MHIVWGCFRFCPIGKHADGETGTYICRRLPDRGTFTATRPRRQGSTPAGRLWVHGPFPARRCPLVNPSSGTGTSQTFSLVYSDSLGAADLPSVWALFNNTLSANSACYLQIDLAHNLVLLADDAASTWGSGIPLGSSANLQNSQCSLNGAVSGFIQSGTR